MNMDMVVNMDKNNDKDVDMDRNWIKNGYT